MMVLVPGLLALVFGWFAFRSRVTGVYFSIITQALTYALMLAFFRNDMGFGGNNGFTDFKDILGFDLHSDRTRVVLLVITAVALGGQLPGLPRDCRIARRARDARHPRRGEPDAFSRLSGRILQAVDLRVFGRHRRHRRRAVRAANRHHQPERVFADQFDRSRHLGGGRRARHALRRDRRRGAGELREDLSHRRVSRSLALRAGRVVRAGDAVSAARDYRSGLRRRTSQERPKTK